MRLNDEDSGKGFNLVPQTYGIDVPSTCTIVIIAGKRQPYWWFMKITWCMVFMTQIFRKVPWQGGQGHDPGGQDHWQHCSHACGCIHLQGQGKWCSPLLKRYQVTSWKAKLDKYLN